MSSNKKYFTIFNKSNWAKLEKVQIETKGSLTFLTFTSSTKTLSKTSTMESDDLVQKYPSEMNLVPYKDLIQRLKSMQEVTTTPPKKQIEKKKSQIREPLTLLPMDPEVITNDDGVEVMIYFSERN